MIRVWHISDPHLSFDNQYNIRKPMDKRKWSIGSPNYVGYLDKIAEMGKGEISNSDFVIITGDLTHDQKQRIAVYCMNWLRENINGTIIVIRGNHDRYIDFARLRMEFGGPRFYFIDENELLSLGPYTFGCFSDHVKEEQQIDKQRYVQMAMEIVKQSHIKKTIPVMLSHYPVRLDVAEMIGKIGLRAYLSGHVHCTKGEMPDGNDWTWYDKNAAPTDDKTIGTCFFSTGTTDILLQKHGKIFKHIKSLDQNIVPQKLANSLVQVAAQAFKCNPKFVSKFEKEDPLNKGNMICGYVCRKKGTMQGSLLITHVNGVRCENQLIYGTPKLQYPYESTSSRKFLKLKADAVWVSEKWNGMNVVFYKYFDAFGELYITGKSKGTAFLSDGDFGNFLSLTREVLNFHSNFMTEDLHGDLMLLLDEEIQSISMELCGNKEPHLVKYNFDLELKPLFVTYADGNIKPYQDPNFGAYISNVDIDKSCQVLQDADLKTNQQYRAANNLPHRYEYEHFAVEGKALYLLDADGYVIDRTMYKVKPSDIEDVHWASFDKTMQGRVIEAIKKLGVANEAVSEESMRSELDMGEKEWSRFGKPVMQYIDILQKQDEDDNREVVVLVGLPGSGKSTVAELLVEKGYARVNQDELGSRNKCKGLMVEAVKAGKKVVIDRVNFDKQQRSSWIDLAHKLGVMKIRCVWLNFDKDTCKSRVATRVNHPTIKDAQTGNHVIDKFYKLFEEPDIAEGFANVEVYNEGSANDIADKIINE